MTAHETVSSIFTNDALALLDARLEDAQQPSDFIVAADDMAQNPDYLLTLPTPIELTVDLNVEDDGENAGYIYEAIGTLDRANASDPRLWSFLSIISFREYMLRRWPLEGAKNFKNQARDHWLLTSSSPRRMMRNGAARLWWIADLTFDPELEHPLSRNTGDAFAYTKWVLENENRRQSIFERQLGRSPRLRWAVLESLQEIQDPGEPDRSKELLKKVYLHTGYQRLELLPDEELKRVVYSLLKEMD